MNHPPAPSLDNGEEEIPPLLHSSWGHDHLPVLLFGSILLTLLKQGS